MSQQVKILTEAQEQFLNVAADDGYLHQYFYLTGGTPLAAFYLFHRVSEDLDLFSEQEFDLLPIRTFVRKVQNKLKVKEVDYRQFFGLHTFFFGFSKTNVLKVDFNYYPFPRIGRGKKYRNIEIDSVLDIAVNKVQTIVMRPRARDFIDLYFIIKKEKYGFYDLLMKAKAKFDWHIDPIQLGSRLFQAKDVKDFPRMIKKIDHGEWQDFFVREAKRLKKEILI